MKTEGVGVVFLQKVLYRGADFDPGAGQENAKTCAGQAIGIEFVDGAESRKIGRVIDIQTWAHLEAAARHGSVAGAGADREYEGRVLQVPYPHRVKALVVDAKRGQKPAYGHREIGIGNVVQLQVIDFLFHRAAETTAVVLEVRGKFGARFYQPFLANGQQQDGVKNGS